MRCAEILDAIVSHAMATGLFDRVNLHEPKSKNAAGNGLTCAVWIQRMAPIKASGLASSSVLVTLTIRIYTNMLAEPQDAIDPRVMEAVDTLVAAYHQDLELGGEARSIDVLGAYGPGLGATAGYLSQDGRLYRVMDIDLPIAINDAWPQAA